MVGPIQMLVVDASVAVKFITAEAGSDAAHEIIVSADVLIAPDWLLVEVASAMWKKIKRSQLLEIHAEDNLASLPEFFARLYPARELLDEAFRLSFRVRHPVYDCLYLALAVREEAELITADLPFYDAVRRYGFDGARLLTWT